MIDLHCHSLFSDGLHTPEELLQKAEEANLQLLALTDHDTFEGSKYLCEISKTVTIITGIELSARWKKYDIHILGYNLDLNCPNLKTIVEQQQNSRMVRAQLIGDKLEAFGIADAFAKASEIAGHKRVGRPHFAELLVRESFVREKQDAFSRYLSQGKPAYVPTPWISVMEAVSAITNAKGQAVLAHPLKYALSATKLKELITEFKEAGGLGIEVVSGEIQPKQIQQLTNLANRYELLASSGSDFHGEGRSRVRLGRQHPLPENCKPIWQQWPI